MVLRELNQKKSMGLSPRARAAPLELHHVPSDNGASGFKVASGSLNAPGYCRKRPLAFLPMAGSTTGPARALRGPSGDGSSPRSWRLARGLPGTPRRLLEESRFVLGFSFLCYSLIIVFQK